MASYRQCYFLLRISAGIFGSAHWVYGKGFDLEEVVMFKSLEGTVEAGPQLVLQLYIMTRLGLYLDKTEGEKCT